MLKSEKFQEPVNHLMAGIQVETGFQVLICDRNNDIILATDHTRIGDRYIGPLRTLQDTPQGYAVTAEEAARNTAAQEGYHCPVFAQGEMVAGVFVAGRLELARPLARIAAKTIDRWILQFNDQDRQDHTEDKYRHIFEHSLRGMYQASMDGRFLSINRALAEICGYASPQAMMGHITDIATQLYVDPQGRERLLHALKKRNYLTGFETRFRHVGGHSIDVGIDARLVRHPVTGQWHIEGIIEDITEKKKAEAAIRLSEEKFQKAFNSSPVWVILSSVKTGLYIEVNDTFLKTMGYTRQEVIGRTAEELGTWIDPADRLKIIETIKAHAKVRNYEVKRQTKDGCVLSMLFSADIIEVSGEACLISVSQDISDYKRMEENLRQSECDLRTTLQSVKESQRLLASITANIPGVVFEFHATADHRYTVRYVSEKISTYFGIDASFDEVFAAFFACIPENEKAGFIASIENAVDQPQPWHYEGRFKRPDGQTIWFAGSAMPQQVENGRLFHGVLMDITERKRWERSLAQSEHRYKELFNEAPVMYVITETREKKSYIQDANAMFLEVLGYQHNDVIGTPLAQYYTGESRPQLLDEGGYEDASTGKFTAAERNLLTRDGELVNTVLHALPDYDSKGRVCGSRAMFLDITSRKKAEKKASRLEAALAQAQKMEAIGTLAGGIAHDFNNILSAVIGYAELTLTEMQQGTRLHRNLEQILLAGMRARDLIGQILAFSRQHDRELIPLQVGPAIKEALKLLRASLPTTIDIVQKIDTDIDDVMADPTQVQQIVMNLSTNAAHAMEENGGQLTVRVSQIELDMDAVDQLPDLEPGSFIKLSVQDTGNGIPPDIIDMIFNPYFTTKETGKGTGLGLSVVHGIVKSYSGAMDVVSQPDRGSTFHVYIPALNSRTTHSETPPAGLPTGHQRILLVDDEQPLIDIGRSILGLLGYDVITCRGGLEALKVFKRAPDDFDLVITDVTMPKMTGDVLAVELLKIKNDLPIILCTGFSGKLSRERAMRLGVKGYLMKPVVAEELAKTVHKVLTQE